MYRILVINLGGTSAKLAIYEDEKLVCDHSFDYSKDEVDMVLTGRQEVEVKARNINAWLDSIALSVSDLDAFAVRGSGLFFGGEGGTFVIEGKLRERLASLYTPDKKIIHASYIALGLVDELQKDLDKKIPMLITDPSTIDQMLPEAHLTGNPRFTKRSAFHALNHRAVARKAAAELGKNYEQVNLIVVHMGGGISIAAHRRGRIIDVNDGTGDGNGPFTPDRAGSLPTGQLVHLCFTGGYTEAEVFRMLKGEAGVKSYLGTADMREVEKMIDEGNDEAKLVFNAMVHQICREIGACYAVLDCEVDAVVFTAGMAHSDRLINSISKKVGRMASFLRYPSGFENEALALGAYRVLSGQEEPAVYEGEGNNLTTINPN